MTDNFANMMVYLKNEGIIPEHNSKGNCDKYYVIELIRRGKDHPELSAANVHFKNFYITCFDDYKKFEKDIKLLCDVMKMRAYISLNYKSFKQVTLDCIAETARRVAAHDLKRPYAIWESCSGSYLAHGNNRWLIDVDREKWMTDEDFENYKNDVQDAINKCFSNHKKNGSNIIWENPSKTGWHFITCGFKRDVKEGDTKYEDSYAYNYRTVQTKYAQPNEVLHTNDWAEMIHENHVTLLYENL